MINSYLSLRVVSQRVLGLTANDFKGFKNVLENYPKQWHRNFHCIFCIKDLLIINKDSFRSTF